MAGCPGIFPWRVLKALFHHRRSQAKPRGIYINACIYCVIMGRLGYQTLGRKMTFSGLLEKSSSISFAASTLSAEKQTLVVPVGSLTTFARSVNFS